MSQLIVTVSPSSSDASFTVFHLHGHLDAQEVSRLESYYHLESVQGRRKWIMDLSQLEYISSAGLGSFIAALGKLREEGGDIFFVGVPRKIGRILELLGFNRIFRVFENEIEALRA